MRVKSILLSFFLIAALSCKECPETNDCSKCPKETLVITEQDYLTEKQLYYLSLKQEMDNNQSSNKEFSPAELVFLKSQCLNKNEKKNVLKDYNQLSKEDFFDRRQEILNRCFATGTLERSIIDEELKDPCPDDNRTDCCQANILVHRDTKIELLSDNGIIRLIDLNTIETFEIVNNKLLIPIENLTTELNNSDPSLNNPCFINQDLGFRITSNFFKKQFTIYPSKLR